MARSGHGALMRWRVWCIVAALLSLMLSGCVPQTIVTQPHLLLRIRNEAGQSVAAKTTLYWWEYPHRRQRAVHVESAGVDELTVFTETVATEILLPLVPHGVPAYNWSFCVEAEDYKTLIGTVSNVEPGDKIELDLVLHPGESLPVCADYERLPNHRGTPVGEIESSAGRVYGVYEVDSAAP